MSSIHTVQAMKGLEPYSLPFCFLLIPRTYFRDTLLLGYASTELHYLLRTALLSAWPDCIQRESVVSGRLLRIKLRGRPFAAAGADGATEDTLESQELLTAVLRVFYHAQWGLRASVNLARSGKACSLFFERMTSALSPSPTLLSGLLFGAIGLVRSDRMLLTGLCALPPFAELVRAVVDSTWPPGLASTKCYNGGGSGSSCGHAVRLTLRGKPWRNTRAESRDLLLTLVRALAAHSIRVYASSQPQPVARGPDTIFVARVPFPCLLGDTFLLGLHGHAGVHLIEAPEAVVTVVRQCIRTVWRPHHGQEVEIGDEEAAGGAYHTFELPDRPWLGGYGGLMARYLLVRLFEELRALGWRLHATFDPGNNTDDLSCFCFERCLPMAHAYLALSLGRSGRLRFINSPPDVVDDVRREISMCWPKAVRSVGLYEGFPEFVLRVSLEESESILSRLLFAMEQWGWRLVAAAEVCAAPPASRLGLRRRKTPPSSSAASNSGSSNGNGTTQRGNTATDLSTLFFERRIELTLALPPPPPTLAGSLMSVR